VKLLINLIKENNKISTTTLARLLGVTRMTIARDIEILKKKGLLVRIGPAKGGHWELYI
jgi:ATP-dependent DNA helicase RecG